jgi:hypothetical protein
MRAARANLSPEVSLPLVADLITSRAPSRALVSVLAFASVLACSACARDFDGLLTKADGSSGTGSSGSSGTSGNGSSGGATSGNGGDACACPSCKGTSCSFACPAGCKSCACDRFVCPDEQSCKVDCAAGASCDVTCPESANCTVTCAKDAQCTCSGDGNCSLACADGNKRSCSGKTVACNRDCP